MKTILKFLLKMLSALFNYLRDYQRYILYSSISKRKTLKRNITILYHVIEKGLSFKNSKAWFGKNHVIKLTQLIDIYLKNFGLQEEVCHFGISNVRTYYQENLMKGSPQNSLEKYLQSWLKKYEDLDYRHLGGAKIISTEEILKEGKIDKIFFSSRHSIRDFSPVKVSEEKIREAISISQKTPSVCNRQNTKIHIYSDEHQIKKLLSYQNGNKGFNNINNLIIITYEIGGFQGSGERNQGWIDSGMRAMSLIYALHALGIGSCCLNWCTGNFWKDIKVKKIGNIPNSESISMMLAIGHLPKGEIKVTVSPELKIDTVSSFHTNEYLGK